MSEFSPPEALTYAFVALTLVVAAADVAFVRFAAPADRRTRWTMLAVLSAVVWLAAHAGIASSGVLVGEAFPPPIMPYMVTTFAAAFVVAFSRVGAALSAVPLVALIGLQTFRLPLEWMLHTLYEAGDLPMQMTWSGYNFDVVTAIVALGIVGWSMSGRAVPRGVLWAWNIGGLLLLLTVVTIALLSTPLPIRQFHNEPAVVLVFHMPYNWIVNVHVWTALVGHLVIFRALRRPDVDA